MADTNIEWADKVWNPIAGCTKCSLGCVNCYAERMAWRLQNMGIYPYHQHPDLEPITKKGWTGIITCNDKALDHPLHWRKPSRTFVCSMSDLFHKKVPFEFIDKVFAVATLCPQHTFLILTKRADRALEYVLQEPRGEIDHAITDGLTYFVGRGKKYAGKGLTKHLRNKTRLWPLPNIHFGVSISNQAEADEKIPILLQIPAAVRFLSIEPMLGPIDLENVTMELPSGNAVVRGTVLGSDGRFFTPGGAKGIGVDGLIVGCESGPKRRPCKIEWVESVVEQCKTADVPCFVKQISLNGKVVKMPNGFPQEYPERR